MNLPLPAHVLSKLIQVIGYVSSSRDDIITIAARHILELFDVDACVFALVEKDGARVTTVTSSDVTIQEGLCGKGCTGPCAAMNDGLLMRVEDAAKDPGCSGSVISGWSGSHLCVPLSMRGERLGVMTVAAKAAHVFTAEEIDLYLAVASLVTISIQNAEQHSESERNANELRVQVYDQTRVIRAVNRVSERLNAATSRAEAVAALAHGINDVVSCDRATLALVDGDDRVTVTVLRGEVSNRCKDGIPLSETVLAHLAKTGKARVQHTSPPPKASCLVGPEARSYIIAPLTAGERLLGSLNVARLGDPNLPHSDLPNITQVAGQAAAALQRIELFEREKAANAELQTLYTASNALTSTVLLRDTYRIITRQLALATGGDCCLLFRVDQNGARLVASHGGAIERDHPSLRVALPRDIVDGTLAATRYEQSLYGGVSGGWLKGLASHLGSRIMLVPIRDREDAVAMAIVARGERDFDDADLRIASSLAGQAAVAVQASQVYEHERTIAEAFQRNLLPPADYRRLGLCVAGKYQAALEEAEVGGDFYDIIEIDDRYVGIAVGDVSGKGLSAATQAAAAKYMLEAYALEDPSPARVLSRLNVAAYRSLGDNFVTLFYGLIDLYEGQMTYANAGHELPIGIRSGAPPRTLDVTGPALALVEDADYTSKVVGMEDHDLVLCYTDGITEARRDKQLWGFDGLTAALTQCPATHPRAVVDHVYERALDYSRGRLADDVILLAIAKG